MTTRRIKSESIENLKRVVEVKDDNVEIVGDMGVVMADAYAESVKNEEHIEEVKDDLEKKADYIKTENPDTGKEVKNEFTAKLVLDEAMEDYVAPQPSKPTKVYDDDQFDTYWDMDMFDFIYELVSISDPRRKPIDPLGRPHARFSVTGRDKYAGLTDEQKRIEKDREKKMIADGVDVNQVGASQVASSGNYIEVYAYDLFRFDDIREICKIYKFKTKGPEETYKLKRNRFMMAAKDEWITYPYVFRIYVPCDNSGYPMMIEDYFETLGLKLEDVMNAGFCEHYRKIEARIQAEADKLREKEEKDRTRNYKLANTAAKAAIKSGINQLFMDLRTNPDAKVGDYVEGAIDEMFINCPPNLEIISPTDEELPWAQDLIDFTKSWLLTKFEKSKFHVTAEEINAAFEAELQ